MKTRRQQTRERRLQASLEKPDLLRFTDKVVEEIIAEVDLPDNLTPAEKKKSGGDEREDGPNQLPDRERLKELLLLFGKDFLRDSLSTDPRTRESYKRISRLSQSLLEVLVDQNKDREHQLSRQMLFDLMEGAHESVKHYGYPFGSEAIRKEPLKLNEIRDKFESLIPAIQILKVSADYAANIVCSVRHQNKWDC